MAAETYRLKQDARTGLIYVGSSTGVLEFDGVRWTVLLHIPSDVHALLIDRRGRLWRGVTNDIQVSVPSADGEWTTTSVRDRLPAGSLPITHAYYSLETPGGIYFGDLHRLYFFGNDDKPARVWTLGSGATAIFGLWYMDGSPFVALQDDTVLRLRGNDWEPVPALRGGALAARPVAGGGWQLLKATGVDHWDGTRSTRVSQPLGDDIAQCATFMADGGMAFGTHSSGVIVCDRDGRFLRRIDSTHGLPSNHVLDVLEDREGGVWAVLVKGVARLQLDTPLARHGPLQEIEGMPLCFAEHRGALYLGTSEGLFRREVDGKFSRIHGVVPQIRRLLSMGDDLYIVGDRMHILGPKDGDRARTLDGRYLVGLVPLETSPGVFVYGYHEGVGWARGDGTTWKEDGLLPAGHSAANVIHQGPAGVIWAVDGAGLWRFDLRAGVRGDAPAVMYGTAQGLPKRDVRMFTLGHDVVALTQDVGHGQMLRFDEAVGRFVPELRIGGLPKSDRYPGAAGDVDRVLMDGAGALWLQMPEPRRPIFRTALHESDRWWAERLPGPTLAAARPNALWHEAATQTLWVAAPGGLTSRDLAWKPSRAPVAPAALVRRVMLASGRALYGGAKRRDEGGGGVESITLDSSDVALRVQFAAPVFDTDELGKTPTLYRTRLEGLETEWSAWTRETQRDFTNLPWRALVFHVQARDAEGRIGAEDSFRFFIAAPGWATPLAWTVYGLLAAVGVVGVVRVRTRALRRRAERLELTIADRTRELAVSNDQLATQNAELARLHQLELDEKLAAQLSEEKARLELLRYQLNPHFLLNAFTTLRGLVYSSPEAAGKTVERLADFCRLALTRTDANASVDDEVRLIESYLDTEKARWRDELQVEIIVDPTARALPLPPFLLQPLVENAVKYGGRTTPDTLRVRVSITLVENDLIVEVANTGTWVEVSSPLRAGSTGIGLENLRQRLRRQYRDCHEFSTTSADGWVSVKLKLKNSRQILS